MSKLSYPRYQHRSGWNALLPPRTNTQSLSAHLNVNVAVIGAGYTGIAAAKRWRELAPDDAIAIIDATVIGEEYQVLHTIIHQGRVDKTFLGGVTKH